MGAFAVIFVYSFPFTVAVAESVFALFGTGGSQGSRKWCSEAGTGKCFASSRHVASPLTALPPSQATSV